MKSRYVAMTIGPVFITMKAARSTKAMWASSYLFSWLMREILSAIHDKKGVHLLNISYNDKYNADQQKKGVGLFPDRFVAKLDPDASIDLKAIAQQVVARLADKMADDLNLAKRKKDSKQIKPSGFYAARDIQQYLTDYLRLLAVNLELDDSEPNPVKVIDDFLNSMELESSFVPKQEQDYLGDFFEELLYNFFIRDEFDKRGFRSTPEIATSTFRQKDPAQYDRLVEDLREWDGDNSETARKKQEDFIKDVKAIARDRFKLCHKYIAIVHADGDNMGHMFKYLAELDHADQQKEGTPQGGKSRAKRIGECLFDYSLKAVEKIKSFGGVPVYAGGDDLLFFAPISVEGKDLDRTHIFDLIGDLDRLFEQMVLTHEVLAPILPGLLDKGKLPAMSYGLSMSHHKYPLGESLQKAQDDLLFGAIKAGNTRNAIAWRLTKHSGAGFGCVLKKGETHGVFKAFEAFSKVKLPSGAKPDTFLASIIFKLESLEGLFQATATSHVFAEHFYQIIFNNFNERIHRDPQDKLKLSPFLEKVLDLLVAAFTENPVANISNPDARQKQVRDNLSIAYALLRFIHFLDTSDKS